MFRPNRPSDRSLALAAVGVLVLGLSACGNDTTPAEPTDPPAPTTTVTVTETGVAPGTPEEVEPTEAPEPEPTEVDPTDATPDPDLEGDGLGDPMDQHAPFDIRVETQNFSIEAREIETDGDGTQMGSHVTVCYTNEIDGMEKAPVTLEPWSFGVYDGETMEKTFFMPVTDTEPGTFQEPNYEPTELAVGECQEGWVQITTGNPHLIPFYLRYERADTGERVTFGGDITEQSPPPIEGE